MGLPLFLLNLANNNLFSNNNNNDDNWHEKVATIYRENGVAFETTPEFRNVMAIRSFTAVSREAPRGVFDDVMIVVWSTAKGSDLRWRIFSANTDPSFQYKSGRNEGVKAKDRIRAGKSDEGLDADGDGRNDLGMLPPGAYQYHTTASKATNTVLELVFKPVQDANKPNGLRVWRDINQDGQYTDADEKLVKHADRMHEGYTMYIHRASKTAGTDNTWSAGCQTLRYEDFQEFKEIIETGAKHGQKTFTYFLVNTW